MLWGKKPGISAPWHILSSQSQLDEIDHASHSRPQLIFKHSTRCSISSMAEARLNDATSQLTAGMDLHHLDLITHRDVSNAIAERYSVAHQSPQALLIVKGECVLEQDHYDVRPAELMEVANQST